MYDVINNLYHLIVSFQMETGNVTDRFNNISVSIGLQNVMDRCGTDQKATRCDGNIVIVSPQGEFHSWVEFAPFSGQTYLSVYMFNRDEISPLL